MHFFGRSGISKICRKVHIFQDPGLKKNAYTQFPPPKFCIFSRKMHVFAAQALTQKMHIHLVGFFGGPKNAYPHFWKIVDMHFLLALDPEKMHIPDLQKRLIYIFSKKTQVWAAQTLTQKMHIHLGGFWGVQKKHIQDSRNHNIGTTCLVPVLALPTLSEVYLPMRWL